MNQISSNQEREFFRVAAELQVNYGEDTPEGRSAMALDRELWQTQSELELAARQALDHDALDEAQSGILAIIKWMDFKLDLILHMLRAKELGRYFPHRLITRDISGSGFGFDACEGLDTGRIILICITLPEAPGKPIYATGEVIHREDCLEENQAAAGVRFLDISDADRERLIRFNFREQRKQLALRAEENEL